MVQPDNENTQMCSIHRTSKMSMDGWWMVHTTVRPVSTVLRTARMTMAAARASRPLVGSSMNTIEGLATSSTAMVSRLRCSTLSPFWPVQHVAFD